MNDRAYRICLLQALVPFVVGVFVCSRSLTNLFSLQIQDLQAAFFVASLTMCLGVTAIWRNYVYWSKFRWLSTGAVTLLVLVHLVVWSPILRSPARFPMYWLRIGQSASIAGLWCFACNYLWWAGALTPARLGKPRGRLIGRFAMSPDTVRLTIGAALIPFLPGLFLFALGAIATVRSSSGTRDEAAWAALQLCSATAILVWFYLWRRKIQWTPRRKGITLVLAGLLAFSPLSIFIPYGLASAGSRSWVELLEALRWSLPFLTAAVWFGGTARCWRDLPLDSQNNERTGHESLFTVRCPKCSYNLTGLREVRCPECGWTSTIDDIVNRSLAEQFTLSGGSI